MAAARFSRIRNAPRLNAANTAYEAWWAARDTRTPDVGGGTARGRLIKLGITPFGVQSDFDALVSVTDRSRTALSGAIGTHASVAATEDRRIAGFKPAKVIAFFGTGTSAPATSAMTNIRYLKRNGESYTHPFGSSTSTEREWEAFSSIENAIAAAANRTVSYSPESFSRR